MSEVHVKENESLDSALRRWKKSCARSGVLAEVRKREHYEKPSVRRKKKSEAARKRKFKYLRGCCKMRKKAFCRTLFLRMADSCLSDGVHPLEQIETVPEGLLVNPLLPQPALLVFRILKTEDQMPAVLS